MLKLTTYAEFCAAPAKEQFILFEDREFNINNGYREPVVVIKDKDYYYLGHGEFLLVTGVPAEAVRWSRAEDYSNIAQLEKHDMRRLVAACKSISKKLNNCLTVEDYAKLFAHGTQAQNLINEFGPNSDKVDLSLDLMFADYINDRIFDENYNRRSLDPEYLIQSDKRDAVTRYLVSGFNPLDYWKQYYSMVASLNQISVARTGYVSSFNEGN